MEEYDFLYIHPSGNPIEEEIPIGLVGAISNLKIKKIGIYDSYINQDIIRNSKIIALDIHWYHNMAQAISLLNFIKKYSNAKVIAGGHTATIFSHFLIRLGFDEIITGDAEIKLEKYVYHTLSINNNDNNSEFNQKKFNSTDYTDFGWFKNYKFYNKTPPTLVIYKGKCVNRDINSTKCSNCKIDNDNFKNNETSLKRSAENIIKDLNFYSNKKMHINIPCDLISILNRKSLLKIFSFRYNAEVSINTTRFYTLDELKLLRNSFKKINLIFFCLEYEKFLTAEGKEFLKNCKNLNINIKYGNSTEIINKNKELIDLIEIPKYSESNEEKEFVKFYTKSLDFILLKRLNENYPDFISKTKEWIKKHHRDQFTYRDQEDNNIIEELIRSGRGFDKLKIISFIISSETKPISNKNIISNISHDKKLIFDKEKNKTIFIFKNKIKNYDSKDNLYFVISFYEPISKKILINGLFFKIENNNITNNDFEFSPGI